MYTTAAHGGHTERLPNISQIDSFKIVGYLGDRLKNNEAVWLHHVWENNPALFEVFRERDAHPRCIVPWFGEYPGKILTGMALTYRMSGDSETLRAGRELIERLKALQGDDGYLGPHPKERRFNGPMHEDTMAVFQWEHAMLWDVWGHYHCIYGLHQWYAATGDTAALDIAIKAADSVYAYFIAGDRPFSSAGETEMNLTIGHAFALLYRETGRQAYLTAAESVVAEWSKEGCGNWFQDALAGKDFYAMEKKRWEALHGVMTLAELYRATGRTEYYTALENIWRSIVRTDRHNDGGFSSSEGAVGDPYRLEPIETCCTVAWMALSTDYLKLSHMSCAADELELSFFNAALGSLTQNDYIFTYDVPMNGQRIGADVTLRWQTIEGARDMNCCQANGSRGLSQVVEWAAFSDETGLYLNFYGPCAIAARTPAGRRIRLTEETAYPRDGAVTITLELDEPETFPLHIRIPCWSAATALSVNGVVLTGVRSGLYYTMERAWKSGDVLFLSLDMSPHYWTGGGAVSGRTSVYHGPLLLALDTGASGTDVDACVFERQALDNRVVESGDKDHWLTAAVKNTAGETVRLLDFASCGRDGSWYISWLNVRDAPAAIPAEHGGNPIWNNR